MPGVDPPQENCTSVVRPVYKIHPASSMIAVGFDKNFFLFLGKATSIPGLALPLGRTNALSGSFMWNWAESAALFFPTAPVHLSPCAIFLREENIPVNHFFLARSDLH